ncbi:MAG: hypothetical protein ACK4FP_09150 [Azonexus sp.]
MVVGGYDFLLKVSLGHVQALA